MMETGSNDVMVIKANLKDAFGVRERLVPFLDGQVIKKVDLSAKKLSLIGILVLDSPVNGSQQWDSANVDWGN